MNNINCRNQDELKRKRGDLNRQLLEINSKIEDPRRKISFLKIQSAGETTLEDAAHRWLRNVEQKRIQP